VGDESESAVQVDKVDKMAKPPKTNSFSLIQSMSLDKDGLISLDLLC
jgi:hypothetical protein